MDSSLNVGAQKFNAEARSAKVASTSSSAMAAAIHCNGNNVGHKLIQQLFVEQLLACQRTVIGRQRLVLEGFEFRCDIALGIFQGLATAVIVRHFGGLCERHLDIKTMHTVVFDFQGGNAAARAFACFQLQQEFAAISLDATQLIEIRIIAISDNAAFAQHTGWFRAQRTLQQRD